MKRDEFGLPRRTMLFGDVCVWDVLMFGALTLLAAWLFWGLPTLIR